MPALFCTSKASKLGTCACIGGGAGEFAGECGAVLVGGLFGGAYRYACEAASVLVLLYQKNK